MRIRGGLHLTHPHGDAHERRHEREKRLMRQGKSTASEMRINDCLVKYRHRRSQDGSTTLSGLMGISDPQTKAQSQRASLSLPHQRRVHAVHCLMPSVETVSVKRGGAAYQVPTPIHPRRRVSLAVRWLLEGAALRVKKDRVPGMDAGLMLEGLYVLRDALSLSSGAGDTDLKDRKSYSMPKRLSMHKTAKQNRVFAHRRWR